MNIKKLITNYNFITTYNKDPFRKSHLRTLYEVLRGMIQEKELSTYYFSHLLFKKDVFNYRDYIGNKKLVRIKNEVFKLNNTNAILQDKILFQKFIEENNIPGPICLAEVKNGSLTTSYSSEKLTTRTSLISQLKELINRCSLSDSLFLKPSNGYGGGGAYKINLAKLDQHDYIDKLLAELQKKDYIIQESVVQHADMNRLHSSSLNTLRIISYRQPTGECGIASIFSRMGCGGAHLDNSSVGGIFVPIDINKGCLEKFGYHFIENGGRSDISHPDSGVVFEGYQLPHFSQSLELVRYAASFFENKIIGWDVAVTINGPILIEGNYNPHLTGTQIACGGFRNHPVYKELFKEYI